MILFGIIYKFFSPDSSYNFIFNFTLAKLPPDKQISLIHFLGSKKPWLTSGVFEKSSEIYHFNFRKFNNSTYHIEHKWKLGSLKELLKAIFLLKILNLKFVAKYLKEFFLSLRV